jgi:hypothetical protein
MVLLLVVPPERRLNDKLRGARVPEVAVRPTRSSTGEGQGRSVVMWLILLLGVATTAFGVSYTAATGANNASVADHIIAGVSLSAAAV